MQDKNITETMYGKWTFNHEVSKCFDEMLNRSIPDFKNLTELITGITTTQNKQKPRILDIGCGTGTSIKPIIERIPQAEYYLIDNSYDMLQQAEKKFKGQNNVNIIHQDITETPITYQNIDICLSILTLQFIPIDYRQKVLTQIYNSLNKKGIFLLVEKVWSNHYEINNILNNMYYSHKQKEYYTKNEINQKKQKLINTLIPLTPQMNQELLQDVGFKKIDIFWKNINFIGYICIK